MPPRRRPTTNSNPKAQHVARPEADAAEPTAVSVSFVTTEHFTLQGERSQNGVGGDRARASMFLASVSGGLIA
jgi:hypothetical protein